MKTIRLLFAAITVAVLTGCATNIAKLPITARDHQTYNNKYAKEYSNKDKNSALRVAIVPQDPSLNGQDKRDLATLKSLTNAFGDGLDTAFSNLSDFEVVPRTEIGAILADKSLTSMTGKTEKYKVKNVNYMLIYRISSYNFEQFTPLLGGKNPKPQFNAYVKVKVSLINLKENIKEFTKTITGKSGSSAPSANIGLLNQAIENAVKDFSTQFAVEYAPPAIVQQTKGSGQVALLNVGKDFGLMKNMKVEFFVFKEKNGAKRVIPFAYGKVIEVAEDSAWVDVDDFELAGVKENHFARVRKDQSKSFLESLPIK
jgi:curli biogenesis system outer membrane secretion channel CsgG